MARSKVKSDRITNVPTKYQLPTPLGFRNISRQEFIGQDHYSKIEIASAQPGEIVFNTMRYRSSEKVQRTGNFQSSVSDIKV